MVTGAITKGHKAMGCCSQTDGTYVWPEGYHHYVTKHGVKPPEHFLRHVLAQRAHRKQLVGSRTHLWWEPTEQRSVAVPRSTIRLLQAKSTLTFPNAQAATRRSTCSRWRCGWRKHLSTPRRQRCWVTACATAAVVVACSAAAALAWVRGA